MKAHKSKNQRVWIKSSKGNVYICPVDASKRFQNPRDPSEAELQRFCLDDSTRPDNY